MEDSYLDAAMEDMLSGRTGFEMHDPSDEGCEDEDGWEDSFPEDDDREDFHSDGFDGYVRGGFGDDIYDD